MLGLVERTLAAKLGPQRAKDLVAELEVAARERGDELVEGVNVPRRDYGDTWDRARGAAYVQLEGAGAVHLELGTWTAFPESRVDQIVADDGLSEFIRLDADPRYGEFDVIADATRMPLRSGVVDRLASNSVLEHIAHPHAVLEECLRVLRPGGVMNHSVPFVIGQHGYPDDHLRYTRGFFERVLPELGFVDVQVDRDGNSGLYYTMHNAIKSAELDPADPQAGAMGDLHRTVSALLGLLVPLDRHFTDGARHWYHSVRVLARKPGEFVPSGRRADRNAPFAERALDLLADPETKQSLVRDRTRLRCASTGTSYGVTRAGAVNFLEPRIPGGSERPAVRRVARAVRRRVQG